MKFQEPGNKKTRSKKTRSKKTGNKKTSDKDQENKMEYTGNAFIITNYYPVLYSPLYLLNNVNYPALKS